MSDRPEPVPGASLGGDQAHRLFRRALLDRLASPEQLNHAMRITDAGHWLALAGCAVILVGAIVWGLFGRIPAKIQSTGILLRGDGLAEVVATSDGQLSSLEVESGTLLSPGQVIARLALPELQARIQALRDELEQRRAEVRGGEAGAPPIPEVDPRERELRHLESERERRSRVVATSSGRVVEVRAGVGDLVSPGMPIVTVERVGAEAALQALLYVESSQAKSVRVGMDVELEPANVRRERDGVVRARVTSVEDFPATRQGMMRVLRNAPLVEALAAEAGGAPVAVHAELVPESANPSGYRWSSGSGPAVELTSGTRCLAAITVGARRPLALVFPGIGSGE